MFTGNTTSTGGLFGNNTGNKPGLFGNSPQPQVNLLGPPKTSLFGSAHPVQKNLDVNNNPIYGTQPYIGKPHIYQNGKGDLYTGITGAIKNYTLEELRAQDHSLHIKRNFLYQEKTWLDAITTANLTKMGEKPSLPHASNKKTYIAPTGANFGSQPASQATNTQNTQSTATFGGATQTPKACEVKIGGLFGNKPTGVNPVPTKQDSQVTQSGGGLFGNKPAGTNQAQSGEGIFGNKPAMTNQTQSGGGLFGNKPAGTNPVPNKQGSQAIQSGGGLFGNKPAQTHQTPTGGLFGNKPAQANPVPNKQNSQVPQPIGGLFGNKPAQTNPIPNLQNNQDVTHQNQPKEALSEKQESSPHPVVQDSSVKSPEEVKEAERVPEKKAAVLNTGSFSYEVNKMVLVSSLISLLQSHKVSVPEHLLDNTDFVPQLFKFFEEYNMNLPTTNIPQFQLNTLGSLFTQPNVSETRSQASSTAQKEVNVTTFREPLFVVESPVLIKEEKISEEEALPESTNEMKQISMAEPPLNLIKEEESEEEEKIETQEEKNGMQNKQSKDEGDDKKQEEGVVENSENEDSENGVLSVGSSRENSGNEEVIIIPKDC